MALSPRFEDALVFATRLHAVQTRKGTMIPYVAHLLGTASIALEHGAGEEEAIAALLHDAIEDAPGDPADVKHEIRKRYGQAVLEIVCGCTDTEERPKHPWKPRKQAYIVDLIGASPSVRLVSGADKLYNAGAILSDCRQIARGPLGPLHGQGGGHALVLPCACPRLRFDGVPKDRRGTGPRGLGGRARSGRSVFRHWYVGPG
jgi:hypothetical protein